MFQRIFRVGVASIKGFSEDGCSAKASALTFYSMLSIVPVLAVAFGIAKGFGFERHLESELSKKFLEQKEVVDKLIDFAQKTLQNTESGLIAGIGVIVLFWTVLKLISSIETSFNAIWKVKKARTLARSFSDYLAMILFCPVFFAASSSLSVFVVTQIIRFSKEQGLWEAVGPVLYVSFHLFPLFLTWFLFSALYLIMPNTKVPIKCALIAGISAGTIYQIVQAVYIQFQIGLSSYGAIYGSFAALPLFLIWLNTSWLIALWGAEIAYHVENDHLEHNRQLLLKTDLKTLAVAVVALIIKAFKSGAPPLSPPLLAKETGGALSDIRKVVDQLLATGLLFEVHWQDRGEYYRPAKEKISLKMVYDALDEGQECYIYPEGISKNALAATKALDSAMEHSPLNIELPPKE